MFFSATFTVMCYNVLCDKYCTRQLYGYCPTWALNWDFRKKGIMDEIKHSQADIICLQVTYNIIWLFYILYTYIVTLFLCPPPLDIRGI